ncbi:MAG: hypothetical protein HY454_01235 [Parcubacteria group bacterium]|nr:hypothetical protein [Parcubacteria group bacterium]
MKSQEQKQQIIEVAKDVLSRVGLEADVKMIDADTNPSDKLAAAVGALPVISIESDKDLSMLIGRNGQNLNALEHIIRLIAARKLGAGETSKDWNFVLDINNYRKAKSQYIVDIARQTAGRVISSQRAETLLPMSSYERRLVHTELASFTEIQTESIGEEPRRRVVVKPLLVNNP